MTAHAIQSLLCIVLGIAAFAYVARHDTRSDLRPAMLTVLGFAVLWMSGKLVIELADAEDVGLIGLYVSYLGACGLGPSWLFLASRFTRCEPVERQPMLLVAAAVPAGLSFFALLTNDAHRLFSSSLNAELLRVPPASWGGPLFWTGLAWQLGLVVVGIAMFLRYAARSMSGAGRRRAQLIAGVACIPLIATVGDQLGWFPPHTEPVRAATVLAVAVIIAVGVRYRLLDFLPLARRDVIDALKDAVVLTDPHGVILDFNPAARQLFGSPQRPLRDAPLARMLAHLAPDPSMEATERAIEHALESVEPVTVALRTRNERELDVSIGCVFDREGEPSARYAVVRDQTEPRRFERLLRESQQRVVVGGLAAGLAHEVNNPLAFVASNLRQIHRVVDFSAHELKSLDESRSRELVELAEVVSETIEGIARIEEIIGRIIRPAALPEEDVVRLDLGHVVQDAVRLVDFHDQGRIPTVVEPMENLPPIEGCPGRLSQALLNLLVNARTAAGSCAEASVFVDAAPDGGGVVVRLGVRDADGAPWPGALPQMASQSPVAEAELSAAYETVREHGGTLETGGDAGTLFVMRLPAA